MSLAERLLHARIESGYTVPAEVAKKIGISPSALYQLEAGATKSLSGETAVKLGTVYPRFRVEWLINGSLPKEHSDPAPASCQVAYGETTPGYVRLSVMEGSASGGDGMVNEDYPEVVRDLEIAEWQLRRQIGFLPAPGRVQLVTVRGDSMYPDIKNGDVVMVDTNAAFYDGDGLYLINIHGHTFVKRMQMMLDGMHVLSTNPKYSNQRIPPDELDQLHFGGRVVGMALMRRAEEV